MPVISDLAGVSHTKGPMQTSYYIASSSSAFVASLLHVLCLGQDLAAFVSGMRNVWLVVVVMLTVTSECS